MFPLQRQKHFEESAPSVESSAQEVQYHGHCVTAEGYFSYSRNGQRTGWRLKACEACCCVGLSFEWNTGLLLTAYISGWKGQEADETEEILTVCPWIGAIDSFSVDSSRILIPNWHQTHDVLRALSQGPSFRTQMGSQSRDESLTPFSRRGKKEKGTFPSRYGLRP